MLINCEETFQQIKLTYSYCWPQIHSLKMVSSPQNKEMSSPITLPLNVEVCYFLVICYKAVDGNNNIAVEDVDNMRLWALDFVYEIKFNYYSKRGCAYVLNFAKWLYCQWWAKLKSQYRSKISNLWNSNPKSHEQKLNPNPKSEPWIPISELQIPIPSRISTIS